jgi:hypothetical protein
MEDKEKYREEMKEKAEALSKGRDLHMVNE